MTTQQHLRPSNYPAAFFTSKERATSSLRRYNKGERIFRPGDAADFVYFIADGKVKISATDGEGKEITKGIFGGGDFFGERAMLGEAKRLDNASALEDTTIRVLSIRDMLLLLNGRSDLTALLMQRIASRSQGVKMRAQATQKFDKFSKFVKFGNPGKSSFLTG